MFTGKSASSFRETSKTHPYPERKQADTTTITELSQAELDKKMPRFQHQIPGSGCMHELTHSSKPSTYHNPLSQAIKTNHFARFVDEIPCRAPIDGTGFQSDSVTVSKQGKKSKKTEEGSSISPRTPLHRDHFTDRQSDKAGARIHRR